MDTERPKRKTSLLDDMLSLVRARKTLLGTFGLSVLGSLVAEQLEPWAGAYVGWLLWGVSLAAGAMLIGVVWRWGARARVEWARTRPERDAAESVPPEGEPASEQTHESARSVVADPTEPSPTEDRVHGFSWSSAVLVSLLVLAVVGIAGLVVDAGRGPLPRATQVPDAAAEDQGRPGRLAAVWTRDIDAGQVTLAWKTLDDVDSIVITSDGHDVELPGWRDSYVLAAQPGTVYNIRVAAYSESDAFLDEEWELVTTPGRPPLSEARLAGVWDVDLSPVSGTGAYAGPDLGDVWEKKWAFRPRCREGACAVKFDLNFAQEGGGVLERRGAYYFGEKMGRRKNCGRAPPGPARVSVRVRVVDAAYVAGEWRARSIRGRMRSVEPEHGGCAFGTKTYGVSGRLRR